MHDRPLHEDAPHVERVDEVHAALTGRVDADLDEVVEQLRPCAPSVGQPLAERGLDPGDQRVVDAQLALARGVLAELPVAGHGQHPAHVLGGDDVQRAPHRVRAHQLAAVERGVDGGERGRTGGPDAERPPAGEELLALHREHVPRGGHGRAGGGGEPMRAQPFAQECRHAPMMPRRADIDRPPRDPLSTAGSPPRDGSPAVPMSSL